MNDLETHFRQNTRRRIHQWMHCFEVYDRHLARFRHTAPVVLELGVAQGGSLQMWREYFGSEARLFGVDVDPACKRFEEDGMRIFLGDRADRDFLRTLARALPPIDILIDDGGPTAAQQIATFEELFGHVQPHGVYLCQNLHASYQRRWGSGDLDRRSFIEYTKHWVDALNAWHAPAPCRLTVSDVTRSAHSVHYYDSVVVVEKRPMQPPHDEARGERLVAPVDRSPRSVVQRLQRWCRRLRGG